MYGPWQPSPIYIHTDDKSGDGTGIGSDLKGRRANFYLAVTIT